MYFERSKTKKKQTDKKKQTNKMQPSSQSRSRTYNDRKEKKSNLNVEYESDGRSTIQTRSRTLNDRKEKEKNPSEKSKKSELTKKHPSVEISDHSEVQMSKWPRIMNSTIHRTS